VRTARDAPVTAEWALAKLREGNERFVRGAGNMRTNFDVAHRQALAEHGQNPIAAIIGCADSRAPIEMLFDAMPGDIFTLRNAGNSLSHAEGSIVGSVEYCVGHLGARLVVVLGHTKCGAVMGATEAMLAAQKVKSAAEKQTTLDKLLVGLGPVVQQAQLELKGSESAEEIAAHAVQVNIFAGIEKLLIYSEPIRTRAKSGEVQLHGAVYDIVSGEVTFLGQHPRLPLILGIHAGLRN